MLGFWGGAAQCLHVCWAQSAATHLRSHGGFHWIVCVCLALRQAHVVCAAVGKIARLKEFWNKASVLINHPNSFVFKSGLFSTKCYCSINTTDSRFRELKLLFSQPWTSQFCHVLKREVPVFWLNYEGFTIELAMKQLCRVFGDGNWTKWASRNIRTSPYLCSLVWESIVSVPLLWLDNRQLWIL